jgi:hypothetical protein
MRGRGALDLSIGYAESCRMTLITAATTLALTIGVPRRPVLHFSVILKKKQTKIVICALPQS